LIAQFCTIIDQHPSIELGKLAQSAVSLREEIEVAGESLTASLTCHLVLVNSQEKESKLHLLSARSTEPLPEESLANRQWLLIVLQVRLLQPFWSRILTNPCSTASSSRYRTSTKYNRKNSSVHHSRNPFSKKKIKKTNTIHHGHRNKTTPLDPRPSTSTSTLQNPTPA
jgi:hypothetical protein